MTINKAFFEKARPVKFGFQPTAPSADLTGKTKITQQSVMGNYIKARKRVKLKQECPFLYLWPPLAKKTQGIILLEEIVLGVSPKPNRKGLPRMSSNPVTVHDTKKPAEVINPTKHPPCPFYGMSSAPVGFIDTRGNQCALKTGRFSPCHMEIEGRRPEWEKCPYNGEENALVVRNLVRYSVVFPEELDPKGGKEWGGVSMATWYHHVVGREFE